MENNCSLINFKAKDIEYIKSILNAFCKNFDKGITIEKRVGYYRNDITYLIYVGKFESVFGLDIDYVYRVDSLDELKGWLYAMVQANHGYLNKFKGGIENEIL